MAFIYEIEVVQLLRAATHAYFGRSADGPADVVTELPDAVAVVDGKGIVGDRFFGVRAHTDAAVTFLAVEAWDDATGGGVDPAVARRNVVVRGVQLDPLRGEEFAVDCGEGPVRFRGARPAHPCAWMDSMVAPGTRKALVGRGGLRARPLDSGTMRVGPARLFSPVVLDAGRAAESVMRAQPLGS